MAINVRNEGAKVNSNINVTPMVDVMLVLLIIFMVITPMLQKSMPVNLARTDNPMQMPDADKEDALIVAIQRDGSIFFDTQKVGPEELTNKVKDRLANRVDKRVYVKADARVPYQHILKVLDALHGHSVVLLASSPTSAEKTGIAPPYGIKVAFGGE